jgi:septal ring factor EnvC (AmiA/AmiB activator)
MFWNATMPVWVALVFIVAFAALFLYMVFVAHRNGTSADLTIERLARKRDEARAQYDKVNMERDILSREVRKSEDAIALYVGELQEARATIKARDLEIERLNKPDLSTLPLQEAVKPERPMRRVMKKKGAQ